MSFVFRLCREGGTMKPIDGVSKTIKNSPSTEAAGPPIPPKVSWIMIMLHVLLS